MKKLTTEERRRRRFTESFRKAQVALIEKGEVSIADVARMYQVKANNVRRWVKKYGNQDFPEAIIIGSQEDFNQLKVIEQENQDLKQLLGEQTVRMVYLEKLVALAKERLGEDFEKK